MHTRPITPADLSDLSVIAVDAMIEDELYEWKNPYRKQYPEDFRQHFVRRLKAKYYDPQAYCYLAETDESDKDWTGKSVSTGYGIFTREGPTSYDSRRENLLKKLERTLLSFADQYNEFWRMDRSIDWARYFEWQEIVKADASLEDNWHLTALAVSPKYQRRGVGSMLVDVGLELAKRDNISSLLESSRVGEKLYSKKGYKILSQFYLNDGTEMGYAMRFDPDGSSETSNS